MSQSKIIMLGASGSGKSCFMLGMFAEMSLYINNFSLIAANQNDGVRLRNAWQRFSEGNGHERWPEGNRNEGTQYEFKLCYEMNPVHQFSWLDYRGGALNELQANPEQKQYREFFLSASCAFLCISGEHLAAGPLDDRALRKIAQKAVVDIMLQDLSYLKEARRIGADKTFPIVIVLTQYDKCRHRSQEELSSDLMRIFDPLFKAGSGWHVAVCPVSMGLDLVHDPDGAPIEPVNAHMPVIFAVYAQLRALLRDAQAERERLSREKAREASRSFLSRFFMGDNRATIDAGITDTESTLRTLTSQAILLSQEIESLDVFLSGQPEDLSSSFREMRLAFDA